MSDPNGPTFPLPVRTRARALHSEALALRIACDLGDLRATARHLERLTRRLSTFTDPTPQESPCP